MENNRFYKILVDRFLSKTASDQELLVFFALLDEGKLEKYLGDKFLEGTGVDGEKSFGDMISLSSGRSKVRWLHRLGIAATIIVASGLLIFFLTRPAAVPEKVPSVTSAYPATDRILPGGLKAMLTLADQSVIPLDSMSAGTIARQDRTSIVAAGKGSIAYLPLHAATGGAHLYNILQTLRGGQYQLTLPDGSKVWLNAASRLRYPVSFTTERRTVELEGEAYFDIAHNPSSPFQVRLKSGENIEVLGTDFNVRCYTNEPVRTTLLSGSVKLDFEGHETYLKPGQEAVVSNAGELQVSRIKNVEQSIAWKQGLFVFDKADITTIMNEIERWYNVDVFYVGEKSKKQFVGKIPRNSTLSQLKGILELSDIHFNVEGRKIFVLPGNK